MNTTFIILSAIYFYDKPLSYSKTRSFFTPKERIDQTLQTISSIRQIVPQAKIVLIEMGLENTEKIFSHKVNTYSYIGRKRIVRVMCDSPFKGLGEIVGLLHLKNILLKDNADIYIKISGRYYLTEDFSLEKISKTKFSFLKRQNTVSTRLYAFPRNLVRTWRITLYKSFFYLVIGNNLERAFIKSISSSKINFVNRLGIAGVIAPTGEYIEE